MTFDVLVHLTIGLSSKQNEAKIINEYFLLLSFYMFYCVYYLCKLLYASNGLSSFMLVLFNLVSKSRRKRKPPTVWQARLSTGICICLFWVYLRLPNYGHHMVSSVSCCRCWLSLLIITGFLFGHSWTLLKC